MTIKYTVYHKGGHFDVTADFYDNNGKEILSIPLGDDTTDKLSFIRGLSKGITELVNLMGEYENDKHKL